MSASTLVAITLASLTLHIITISMVYLIWIGDGENEEIGEYDCTEVHQ